MGSDEAGVLLSGSATNGAWKLLREQDDIGWVTAGKLLARKRPKLIPVWDNVVRCALRPGDEVWLWMNETFQEANGQLPRRLLMLHEEAGLPATVSTLRVLDVVVWMRHHTQHRMSGCRGLL